MIASWIAKRMMRSSFDIMSQEHIDTDALLKQWADDAVWDGTSEFGVGPTIKGKKAIADWFHRWEQQFPRRKLVVKNVCLKGTCLPSPNNVMMVDWTCTQTDKQGLEYKYEGATVIHTRNMKAVRVTEHISFAGLPQLSTLVRPTGGGKMVPVTPDKSSPHPTSGDERQKPGNAKRQSPPRKKRKTRRS